MYEELLKTAMSASSLAYVPYSSFKVGAAVLYEDGSIYTGCNVENVSYGLTLCAERNAISTAIAAGQKGPIKAIAIANPKSQMCYPCGACLQWLSEFCEEDLDIVLEDENHQIALLRLSDLLPHRFKKERLD